MTCAVRRLRVWCMPLRYVSTDTFRWSPSVTIYASQITAVHPQLSPRCVQWRGIWRSKTSGKPIFDHLPDEERHIVDALCDHHQVACPKDLLGLLRQLLSHATLLPHSGVVWTRA